MASACASSGDRADGTDSDSMRKRILGAAFKSFVEKGYAGTSTLEIATRAKVSARDLYASVGNKQAILVAGIRDRTAKMQLRPELPVPRSRQELASIKVTRGGPQVPA